MAVPVNLVWFRHDLRVKDNPALNAACDEGRIVPVYILDSSLPEVEKPGAASKWWLHQSLERLNERLDHHLQFFCGDPKELLPRLIQQFGITQIFWNESFEPWQRERDKTLVRDLQKNNIKARTFRASLLWEPNKICKGDGGTYKVFTPYYRNGCLQAAPPRFPKAPPARVTYQETEHIGCALDSLKLMPDISWYEGLATSWKPGEEGAAEKLSEFIREHANEYKSCRDIPSLPGTSRLSPHLRFGELSPNQVWYSIKDAFGDSNNDSIDTFLSELGWREFNYYLLYHFPELPAKNFNSTFNSFTWRKNSDDLAAWQQGRTGIPIVDAGMRELWQTGFMHNRVRMIVASFLIKNLLIDWRDGQQWFWDCLVDADLANNAANWQWVAGSGADAAPYFRIFNPVLQGEKFDKEGEYVARYVPELSAMPAKYIHKPWEASQNVLKQAQVELGVDYPHPLVDLKASRQRALDAYQRAKGK